MHNLFFLFLPSRCTISCDTFLYITPQFAFLAQLRMAVGHLGTLAKFDFSLRNAALLRIGHLDSNYEYCSMLGRLARFGAVLFFSNGHRAFPLCARAALAVVACQLRLLGVPDSCNHVISIARLPHNWALGLGDLNSAHMLRHSLFLPHSLLLPFTLWGRTSRLVQL